MARLLADEDFDHRMAAHLRHRGHDVLTLATLGAAAKGLRDEQVLALAIQHDRALLTHNRVHFIRLHRQFVDHSGIIVSSHARDAATHAERIDGIICSVPDLRHRLVRVNLADHMIE